MRFLFRQFIHLIRMCLILGILANLLSSLIKNIGYRMDIVMEPFWIWLIFCNYLIYLLFFLFG